MKLNLIDRLLNAFTMFQLLVYGLSLILVSSIGLSLIHLLPIHPLAILLSSAVILTVGFVADRCAALAWSAPNNQYSSLITCLILCCILQPTTNLHHLALLGLISMTAIISKYVIARHHKHLFNPAAIAVLIFGLLGLEPATWWIGSPALLPITSIFGLLILRKLRRFMLFLSFLAASILMTCLVGIINHQQIFDVLIVLFKSSPLIFLGTIMLTEPTTLPPKQWQRVINGALVGLLFTSQLRLGLITATPELAIILGNIFAFKFISKYKLILSFEGKKLLAPGLYELYFSSPRELEFIPGQYMDWTIPQDNSDSRGNRRTFSISSAPGSNQISMGIRVPEKSSSYKKSLMSFSAGDKISAQQLAGDFILPPNKKAKVVLIAGGIGITPFVSMVRDMVQKQEKRDVILLYFIGQENEYCYQNVWSKAAALGVNVIPVLSGSNHEVHWEGVKGRLTLSMLKEQIEDFQERRYYISGPPGLVTAYKKVITGAGINRRQIKTDFFSGY